MADSVKIITPSISVERAVGLGKDKKKRDRDLVPNEPVKEEEVPSEEEQEKDKGAKIDIKI